MRKANAPQLSPDCQYPVNQHDGLQRKHTHTVQPIVNVQIYSPDTGRGSKPSEHSVMGILGLHVAPMISGISKIQNLPCISKRIKIQTHRKGIILGLCL